MKKLTFTLLALLFTFRLFAQEVAADTVYKPVEYPQGFSSKMNVVYTKAKDWEGQMDIYMPPKEKGPTPVVINIHGGGWNKGVRHINIHLSFPLPRFSINHVHF